MKRSKFTESQIVSILKEYEAGQSVKDICRVHKIAAPTFYNWKKKYGGMDTSQLKELKELQAENARLKKMYTDLSLDHFLLKEVIEKKF